MKTGLRILAGITAAVAVLGAGLALYPRKDGQGDGKKDPATRSLVPRPGESVRADWPAEDVFSKAFWRHPSADDRIVDAVRVESAGDDGVSRWAWFIKVHPSAALLQDLRDPLRFGLIPTGSPKPQLPADISAPAWFRITGGEVLQHPVQGMTLRYHADGNLLYVSDHGRGFSKAYGQ
ncbi:hypothetical protein OVA24_17940 [Luteolibacter sp. SL250]|uniref:hypothetical protein n=1 Tax=Luteolibacter sp. SL250 TaxID=2995170 RepID=UPI00226EB897|nr:hypothetical protein [Luteolibacter sp. SL250]WAC19111.1 hypothetical protein OVA24_17940 [Luteolibacter sp. SL250]